MIPAQHFAWRQGVMAGPPVSCKRAAAAAPTIAPVLSVLLITFPFFALVLCGYLAARGGILPQPAIPGLNAFVL